MVQRLEGLADDEAAEPVRRREEDVEFHGARSDLRDRLVQRREERLLDLDAVLLGEVLLDPRPQVAVPVVDAERSALRLEAGRDHRVVVEERPRDRAVRLREHQLRRLEVPVVASAAGREDRAQARKAYDARCRAAEELTPTISRLTWMTHPNLPGTMAPRPSEPESSAVVNPQPRRGHRLPRCQSHRR